VLLIAFAILSLCCFCACGPNGEKKDIAEFTDDSSDITYKDIEKKDGIIASENFVYRNLEVIDEFCKDNARTVLITDSSDLDMVLPQSIVSKYLGVDEESGKILIAPICVVEALYEQEFDINDIFYDETVLNYKSKINEFETTEKYQPYFIRLYAKGESDENIYVGTVLAETSIERKSTEDTLYDNYHINYNISISLQEGYGIESFDLLTLYGGEFYLETVEENVKIAPENLSADISDGLDTGSQDIWGDYTCKVNAKSTARICSVKINRVYKYLKSCDLGCYVVAFTNLKLTSDDGYPVLDEDMSPNYFCDLEFGENAWFACLIADGFNLFFPNLGED
ncbi:MAG: hypothetical protein K2O08_02225, partial [Clostridia bacterium]|nr:hypothetical protein [Clostridia bacterium]